MTSSLDEIAPADSGSPWTDYRFWKEATLAEVNRCLAAGADPNAYLGHGATPLHEVAMLGRADIANALIKAGAKIGAVNHYQDTSLHMAVRWGNAETVEVLLAAGADIDAVNSLLDTPMDVAESPRRGTRFIKLLTDARAAQEAANKKEMDTKGMCR